jgi:O-antigen/teichoic acid export membrane protein
LKESKSYIQIFKSTSLFGGVQILSIIISVIRSKFIAIFLGPTGIGVSGLLTSTIMLISSITNLGIERSSVKNIASANTRGNELMITKIVSVTHYLVWFTGTIGSFIIFIFSPYLSDLAFGNDDFSISFKFIAITVLFNQISSGQIAVLRGLRKLKYMASSSLLGSLIGLIVTIPIYYFYGIDGIVPSIILTSVVTLLITTYYRNNFKDGICS